jgi:hypothetical protein
VPDRHGIGEIDNHAALIAWNILPLFQLEHLAEEGFQMINADLERRLLWLTMAISLLIAVEVVAALPEIQRTGILVAKLLLLIKHGEV